MRNLSKILGFGSILTLLWSVNCFADSAEGKSKYQINWLLAHDPISLFEEAAQLFADRVYTETDGQVRVNVVTNKQDLAPSRVISMVQSGEYEMTQTYTVSLGELHHDLWALDLPFIFENHEHAERVLDGEIGARLLAGLSSSGLEGLTFTYSGGFRVIPSTGHKIEKLEDFKGIKVRTTRSPVANAFFEFVGAEPIVAGLKEGTLLQKNGLVNGGETTYPRFYSLGQNEVSAVINDTKHSLFLTSIVVNQSFFQSLPEEYQEVVRAAAIEAGVLERQISIEDGIRTRKQAEEEGIKVVDISDSEVERIKKEILPLYEERFYPMFGDLIDQIKNERYSITTDKVVSQN